MREPLAFWQPTAVSCGPRRFVFPPSPHVLCRYPLGLFIRCNRTSASLAFCWPNRKMGIPVVLSAGLQTRCVCQPVSSPGYLIGRSSFCHGQRVPAFSVHRPSSAHRRSLQVLASKGKGKKAFRGNAGGQQMQQQAVPTPPIDADNAEFVLFVRSKKLPQWFPLSIVKGGTAANLLVQGLEHEWGRKLYGKTLIRNIGQVLYKDKGKMDREVRKQMPPLKTATELEYGFKIRDKTVPKEWYVPKDITVIPPQSDLGGTPLDNLKEFWARSFQGAA